jgi:beta-lactamase regulating signal transducer with metallopeptidase domain
MRTLLIDTAMWAAFVVTVKASLLLGLAAILQAALPRRTSAATRHLLWALAAVAALMLPILSLALPDWPVAIRTARGPVQSAPLIERASEAVAVASAQDPLAGAARPVPTLSEAAGPSWPTVIADVYAAGVLILLLHLTVHRWRIERCARRATEMRDPEWTRLLAECAGIMGVRRPVRLLRSREGAIPFTFGIRRPSVLVPATADTWAADRRRAVILHELAHVARYDCLTQTLAFAACALYWFHPAAWWVARRLRIERELACDDRVIAAGTQAREYAGHLLEIAYSFAGQRATALAVSMARPRQLEGRMLAALDGSRNRTVPAARIRLAGAALAAVVLCALAAARPTIAEARAVAGPSSDPDPWVASQTPAVLPPHLKGIEGPMGAPGRAVQAVAAAIGMTDDEGPGTWEIRPTNQAGAVHLRLVEEHSTSGSNIPIERLQGLTAAQLAGAGGPVQFRLRLDAGTFTFEGVIRNGVGAGTFSFAPDPAFPAELAKRGFARPTAREQYELARHDVGYVFLDELNRQGYSKPETSELVRAGQHGVQFEYLHDMGALGYRLGSLAPLITLRDHGVTADYVRELAADGYKGLSADALRNARDHGITAEYVRGMRDAGYASVPMDALIGARDHGVTDDFVRELGEAGHRKLPLDQLIRVRDHGVTPDYVRDMRQLGYAIPIEDLIGARDHGITVDFVRDMAALGYTGLPVDALIGARDHGVTPTYAREVKALGYGGVTIAELMTLRDHGLTADRIRAANARAGTRLSVDRLKSFAESGMQ